MTDRSPTARRARRLRRAATGAALATLIPLWGCTPSDSDAQRARGSTSATSPAHVGFDTVRVADGQAESILVGIWYPTDQPGRESRLGGWTQRVATGAPVAGRSRPLVVISHGHGGWLASHHDTAVELARAGFVVAALTHPGDNYADESGATAIDARPRHVRRVIDYMTRAWPEREAIDSARVGIFGFSAGGFTALVASGGVPDVGKLDPHCRRNPAFDDCSVVAANGVTARELVARFPADVWVHDGRIRAAVVAAPALGYMFERSGLAGVRIPVQLWRAADDRILPHPHYAAAVRRALPAPPAYHVVEGAGHFDFVAPCPPPMAAELPAICGSRAGFDRRAFHERFNREVVAFFRRVF